MVERILHGNNRIFYHFLFWMAYVLFFTLTWGSYDGEYWEEFLQLVFLLPWKMIPTYITLYYLMPKYLYPKKMGMYIVITIILAISMAMIDRYMNWKYLYRWFHYEDGHWKDPLWYFPKILNSMLRVYTPVFVAMAIKLQRFYYQKDKINKALEKEKVETELKFLKAQIHPHFLFNTLNSIYSLSLEQSSKTPDAVLGLSKFLDYMLYECNDRLITVEKEWEQLMNLVALERLRYGDQLSITTNIEDDNKESHIPPLILLPFVENAFKHGADNLITDSWINIDLKLENQQLQFMVENSKASSESTEGLDSDKNIGLKNVRRRLDLFFPEKHQLKILEEEDSFLVKLEIDLSDISS
ncbi:sensor histidine kinase [Flagellimonas nanhaiensis]|uniref:Sensor histidine kinase n=1 Tax=Flagellimonas nanhaiensis TaxID=2292706 RepID=A0A371JLW4_9FLAO|nr:histidine kinase [Allomuricauda nanhaiensis]RDY58058.1 sensor histidine kinase [Allomuricauda nanhaiensis]